MISNLTMNLSFRNKNIVTKPEHDGTEFSKVNELYLLQEKLLSIYLFKQEYFICYLI